MEDIFADIPTGRPRPPPTPPRPVNRSSPAAQSLEGPAAADRAPQRPRAPQATALAARGAGADAVPGPPDDIFAGIPLTRPAAAPTQARKVGFAESAARTAGSAATPVVRTAGMGLAGILEVVKQAVSVADAVAPILGMRINMAAGVGAAQDRVFAATDETAQSMRDFYDPQQGEEMSLPGQVAGGIASLPAELLGGLGIARGVERSADVVERGGTLGEAGVAGGVTAVANVAANALPIKVGGAAGRAIERRLGGGRPAAAAGGAATGAALGVAGDKAVVAAENAALPEGEQFEDLKSESNAAVSGGLGAALGALSGAVGAPQVRAPRRAREQSKAAGTPGSAGAAGTDAETLRRERAAQLPVPIALTKADATGDLGQQQFERETAKEQDAGRKLRAFRIQQNADALKNFDLLEEQTGAQVTQLDAAGKAIVDPIIAKAERAKVEIDEAYAAAREAGEMEEAVSSAALVRYLDKNRASARNAGVLGTAEDELVRLGAATRGADGKLESGSITLNDFDELRKTIGVGGKKDKTNESFAGDMRRIIDESMDGAGGDLFKAARKLYSDYQKEFKEQGLIRDLIGLKKNTSDRAVAFENVYKRVTSSGSLADMQNLKRTLTTAGDEGKQAWREMQGTAIRQLREATFGGGSRNEARAAIASPNALNNAIKQLDQKGMLDELFGKQGAVTLRDLGETVRDVFTPTADSVNSSNSGSYVKRMLLDMATTGAPWLTATKFVNDWRRTKKTDKRIDDALAQPAKPLLLRKVDPNARPFDPDVDVPARAARQPASAAAPAGPRDARLDEIDRLREGASPETIKVLDARVKEVEREQRVAQLQAARDAEAKSLEATARKTLDPALKAALIERANKLRSERIPVGEAAELRPEAPTAEPERSIPTGELRELSADEADALVPTAREQELGRLLDRTSDATVRKDIERQIVAERKRAADAIRGEEYLRLADESVDDTLRAEFEARAAKLGVTRTLPVGSVREVDESAWRAAHRFGKLDAESAKAVVKALRYDSQAVARAAEQHARSPRAFERAIARIIEAGERNASKPEEAAGSGAGLRAADR
ncbi:MAG TPA: hypothetical protein VFR90_01500 [Methylibium sp.]|uniref:hypothetical protein n=1 Tax=Methylibium sp. TaxID=2067992 RepID=UPI002DB651C5|nr:hypothetical protein [Methylibium sp.]HEU4457781.1 hypothetical protein [Methylibium sp.]